MITAWMLFSVVTGCALTVAAVAADRLASLSRRPRRFIWLSTSVLTAFWPAISIVRTSLFPLSDAASLAEPMIAGVHRLSTFVVAAPAWEIPPQWSLGLLVAWALCSAVLIGRLAVALSYIRRHQATWGTIDIDGMRVRIAPDAGPAVIGLRQMQVVLPEWVLDMERPLRTLIMRHEAEHRATRDPYLLLLATLTTALMPWNLPLWYQARRLRLALEIDCDARVLRAHPRWREYALLLLTIAQRRTGPAKGLAPALSEPISNLERRITAMRTTPTPSRFSAVCLILVTGVAFAVACAVDKPESPDRLNRARSIAEQARPAVSAQPLDPARAEFFEFQVDEPVTPREDLHLNYPAALKRSGIGGEVLAQFVVDQTGRVDMSTFKLLNAPDPQFAAAVEAALPTWHLEPATMHGTKVRQLVQQSFVFGHPPGA